MRRCAICREWKPLGEYDDRRDRNGWTHREFRCGLCYRQYLRDRYAWRLAWLDALKLERGCADCGYRAHLYAMEFDHRGGEVKTLNIGGALTRWKDHVWLRNIQAEIAKCDVVCANCHKVRTFDRAQNRGRRQEVPQLVAREIGPDQLELPL